MKYKINVNVKNIETKKEVRCSVCEECKEAFKLKVARQEWKENLKDVGVKKVVEDPKFVVPFIGKPYYRVKDYKYEYFYTKDPGTAEEVVTATYICFDCVAQLAKYAKEALKEEKKK